MVQMMPTFLYGRFFGGVAWVVFFYEPQTKEPHSVSHLEQTSNDCSFFSFLIHTHTRTF